MIETDGYVRFERARPSPRHQEGSTAQVEGERLRIELVRDELVRVKISRGGVFDEDPTFAVCVDPLAEPVEFSVERARRECASATYVGDGRHARARSVPARRASRPTERRRGVGSGRRAAGTGPTRRSTTRSRPAPVPPTRMRSSGSARSRDATTDEGRDFTLWNTDVLDPDATARVHRRQVQRTTRGATGRASSSIRTTSPSRSSTTRPTRPGTMAGVVRRQRLPGPVRLHRARRVPHPVRRRAVHRVHLRRARHARTSLRPTPG